MKIPETHPINDDVSLWQLQTELMAEAESVFGLRDSTKKLYQPSWDPDGPNVRYTPNKDGAFAELCPFAEQDWKFAVYQLAHETVHLLDQSGGDKTHLLEEGAAVKFSLDMMVKYGFDTKGFPALQTYRNALSLFESLSSDPYATIKKCRSICGNFTSIDEATLRSECPQIEDKVILDLLSKPTMR